LLPRFYNRVRPITPAERCAFAATAQGEDEWLKKSGLTKLSGDDRFTPDERVKLRPVLEMTEFEAGAPRKGGEADIPSDAMARLSVHLVPDQDPGAVFDQVYEYLSRHCPRQVAWEVREITRTSWYRARLDSLAVLAAAKALKTAFGASPLLRRSGSSDRFMGLFQKHLGVAPVSLGFRLPSTPTGAGSDRQHLPTLMKGVEAVVRLLADPRIIEDGSN
jgi:acetylornithine deacetylase/succinyl-diaminopimelate desuccinylase-like protein